MEVYTVRREEGYFPFPVKYYMRDKTTGEIFRQKITIPDYAGYDFNIRKNSGNPDYGYYYELDLGELKQAYDENRLSGNLKELVSTLNADEDNNIYICACTSNNQLQGFSLLPKIPRAVKYQTVSQSSYLSETEAFRSA